MNKIYMISNIFDDGVFSGAMIVSAPEESAALDIFDEKYGTHDDDIVGYEDDPDMLTIIKERINDHRREMSCAKIEEIGVTEIPSGIIMTCFGS